ncbi:MAG: molybdopterin-dependent oxidoreductase [Pseudomonadota bacterium]
MNSGLSRREFLKAGAGLSVLAAVGGAGVGASADSTRRAGQPDRYRGAPVDAVPSLCEMCFQRCGILGMTRGRQLLGIEGNPDHPLSQGRLCARGLAGSRLLCDPDRLKFPLVRVGERGSGAWRRASWAEALDRVAEGLRTTLDRYGPEAIAFFPHGSSAAYFKALMECLGIGTYASASYGQCRGPRDTGYELTFGGSPGSPERADFESTDAILLIGSHFGENVHTSQVREFIQALSRGARLVVVDPRYSVAAAKADLWLPIRPGTDTALLLAIMRYLITEGLYDRDFVRHHCSGFPELRQAVEHATPDWAAAITDLPPAKIVEAARMLGRVRPRVIVYPGRFVAWYGNDTQRSRALAILCALLGAWGRPGGLFLHSPIQLGKLRRASKDRQSPGRHGTGPQSRPRPPFLHKGYPFQDILQASLEEVERPIKPWFLYGTNVLHSMPTPQRSIEALKRLDFVFMVDVLPSEPSLYADVILPEATYLERYDAPIPVYSAKRPFVALRQPIVEPLYGEPRPVLDRQTVGATPWGLGLHEQRRRGTGHRPAVRRGRQQPRRRRPHRSASWRGQALFWPRAEPPIQHPERQGGVLFQTARGCRNGPGSTL